MDRIGKEIKERIKVDRSNELIQVEFENGRMVIDILLRQSPEHPWLECNFPCSLEQLDRWRELITGSRT